LVNKIPNKIANATKGEAVAGAVVLFASSKYMERNKIMKKQYGTISVKLRKEIEENLKTTLIEQFQKEMVEANFYKYEVQLQSIKFVAYMSNEELEKSIELTIDLLEEMKKVNNGGLNMQILKEKVMSIETQYQDELMSQIVVWNIICNERIHEIIGEIDVVRRVGGAYAMLVSNPCLKSAIYAVYDRLVDNFDDEELYCQSAYFLARAIMRMHSNELESDI